MMNQLFKLNSGKRLSIFLTVILATLMFGACSSDNDAPVSIDTYLKGKWYSYKAVVTVQNQSVELDITKNGQYSVSYLELVFKDDNIVSVSGYQTDENGLSKWVTEEGTYSVNGNIVTINDGTTSTDLFFMSNEKTMYFRGVINDENYGQITTFIYLRK